MRSHAVYQLNFGDIISLNLICIDLPAEEHLCDPCNVVEDEYISFLMYPKYIPQETGNGKKLLLYSYTLNVVKWMVNKSLCARFHCSQITLIICK